VDAPAWLWQYDDKLPSRGAGAGEFLNELERQLVKLGWDSRDRFGVRMAVDEALTNAMRHGNRGDPAKHVTVSCRLACCRLYVEIADEGAGFDPDAVPDPTTPDRLERPNGRGLTLMRAFATRVRFLDGGRRVILEKEREIITMKAHTEYLTLNTPQKRAFLNITPQVAEAVKRSGVREGLCLVNAMHITASVFINDDERGLHHDFEKWLEKLAPFNPDPNVYHHNRTGEDNADAHLKRQVMGREVVVAVTAGKLDFGPWEQIFYGEFDGQRPKRVLVKIIGE